MSTIVIAYITAVFIAIVPLLPTPSHKTRLLAIDYRMFLKWNKKFYSNYPLSINHKKSF